MGREKEVIKQTGRRRGALCEQGPGGPRPSSLRGDVAGVFTEGREHVSQAGALEQVDNARGQEGQPKSPGAGWQWLCGVESTSATDSFLNAAWALRDFGRRIGHCQRRRVCTQSVETHTEAPHLEHLRGPPTPDPLSSPRHSTPQASFITSRFSSIRTLFLPGKGLAAKRWQGRVQGTGLGAPWGRHGPAVRLPTVEMGAFVFISG